jgi:DNA invertase Pin-like site-specific DNA recombinase
MSKITADHLRRAAYVYVRQSTLDQVQHNHESRRRQYALAGRARQLGWQEVVVLDEDLVRSGSGISRPGFERLIAAVGQGRVGAVVSIEASRLARNGRDWHTLLEFCGLVGSLIIDEDGIYDPRLPNDRLLLGMKGTLSEMELSTFRQRSQEALRQKAARGELLTTVAIGYLRTADDRVEIDPDKRVREAISLVFVKFRELGSMRQVLLWLRQESIELPSVTYGAEGRAVVWKLPVYATILKFLTNPIYGGAYAHGRTRTQTRLQDGRRRIQRGLRRSPEDWEVLIIDHHQGYIAWDEYQQNQRLIAENTNMRGQMARGAVRPGPALLAGMLRCGHCGRKLHVAYSGVPPGKVARYHCRGAMGNAPGGASHSAVCASKWRSVARCCACSIRWGSRPLSAPSRCIATRSRTSGDRSSSRSIRRASRQPEREGNMTLSTRITGWSRANWNTAGTSDCGPSSGSKRNWSPAMPNPMQA